MSNKIDVFLSRVSHVSQFVLVAFAIFGYFYTVRPIYQKEVLSEDIAKKEVELNKLKTAMLSSQKSIEQNKALRKDLEGSIAKLDLQYKESEEKLNSINHELKKTLNELNQQKIIAKRAVDANNKNLESVFWENFTGLVGVVYLSKSTDFVNNTLGDTKSAYNTPGSLYLNPYDAISEALKDGNHNFISSSENVPENIRKKILTKIRRAIEKNKATLTTKPIGYDEKISELIKTIKSTKSKNDENTIIKNYNAERELSSYIFQINKQSRVHAMDFLKDIQYID
ncbi:hypothetical protein GC796_16070 [Salmonella enterica]|uniref:Uncharacterized protein n=3 Tax=Salmonella enterica TaxID=28901 RepID=A0A756DQ49_SALER|nr:hypothetical protein [Salmonella enterica subsp. enterica serovar Javiana]EAP8470337.1 hypothetical protein [Salmonella enterica]ECE5833144.1 hypothetical protein [Salmonella enterica subsp. enterica]ECU5732778.1 hypothetical protein [Salmonella enterica subsp. enterica serovar 9,12:-:1,5]EHF3060498.1 hypothetical protein [Salmonella enterica subsp. enterica serovar 9,12-:1,5]